MFFESFSDQLKIYKELKERFHAINKMNIFEEFLTIQDFDDQLEN